jgi:hypothetical protein
MPRVYVIGKVAALEKALVSTGIHHREVLQGSMTVGRARHKTGLGGLSAEFGV